MENKHKVLFLHTGAELYGSDRILLYIVSNLDSKKFIPLVILPNDGPLVEELRKRNVRTEIVPYPIIRRKIFNPFGIVKYFLQYRRSCKKLLDIVRKENISLVHNNTIAVLEGAYLKRKEKLVLVSHVHEIVRSPRFVAKVLYRIQLKNADKVICVSHAVKDNIENLLGKNRKLAVIHNGIAPIVLGKKDKKDYGIPSRAKLFGFVGRMNAMKGQDDFVDAIALARKKNGDIFGIVAGDAFSGQEWRVDELKERIKNAGLDNYIKYLGFVRDVKEIYSAIDVFVLPSVGDDPFPTVVLEAMSCGIPTIAYKSGGVGEMIEENETGYLVEKHDINALSERFRMIEPKKMHDSCINRFTKEFSLDNYIHNMNELYLDLIEGAEDEKR